MKNNNKKRRKRKSRKILSQIKTTGSLTSLMKTNGIAKIVELLTVEMRLNVRNAKSSSSGCVVVAPLRTN